MPRPSSTINAAFIAQTFLEAGQLAQALQQALAKQAPNIEPAPADGNDGFYEIDGVPGFHAQLVYRRPNGNQLVWDAQIHAAERDGFRQTNFGILLSLHGVARAKLDRRIDYRPDGTGGPEPYLLSVFKKTGPEQADEADLLERLLGYDTPRLIRALKTLPQLADRDRCTVELRDEEANIVPALVRLFAA